jgi:hypothetical protein
MIISKRFTIELFMYLSWGWGDRQLTGGNKGGISAESCPIPGAEGLRLYAIDHYINKVDVHPVLVMEFRCFTADACDAHLWVHCRVYVISKLESGGADIERGTPMSPVVGKSKWRSWWRYTRSTHSGKFLLESPAMRKTKKRTHRNVTF